MFWQFLPLGVVAYGGPTAHIALLHERFVDKSKWLTEEQFVELMAVGQGLPGPTSTQVCLRVCVCECARALGVAVGGRVWLGWVAFCVCH